MTLRIGGQVGDLEQTTEVIHIAVHVTGDANVCRVGEINDMSMPAGRGPKRLGCTIQ
jgi:hypothetical protein